MAPVVLEMDVNCPGCAKKIQKAIKNMPGVARVSVSVDTGQVVVEGRADAAALKARLQAKLRKAVTIVIDGADPPPPPHYPPPPPPAGPPMDGGYQPYGWMPPPHPHYYAPPPPTEGVYYPYGVPDPSVMYDRQYVPNDGPTYFSDENPNACSIQ